MRALLTGTIGISLALLMLPLAANAQSASQDQLRSTINSEITADPRSQTLTQTQIYGLVNALTENADKQGITTSQLTYRPQTPGYESSSTLTPCADFTCSLSRAFGLDGSFPLIPLLFFIVGALFVLIYSLMREMGHPHAQA